MPRLTRLEYYQPGCSYYYDHGNIDGYYDYNYRDYNYNDYSSHDCAFNNMAPASKVYPTLLQHPGRPIPSTSRWTTSIGEEDVKCPISIISLFGLYEFLDKRHGLRILVLGTVGLGLLTYLTLVLSLKYCIRI